MTRLPDDAARRVTLGDDGLRLDGRRKALVAGQFEAFRHNARFWPRILDAIRDAGIDIVSTYFAWDFHEVLPGEIDVTGRTDPARDVPRFLELCAERGMHVLARPGPWIDASWETRGPPPDVMDLDRLDPRFIERASGWLAALAEVLVPAQVTHGGPVLMVGMDNEVVYPWVTSAEEHRATGTNRLRYDARYHDAALRAWLKRRHGRLDVMNRRLGTAFARWRDVHGPRYAVDPPAYGHEAVRFANERVERYLRWCAELLHAAGINVPLYTNVFQSVAIFDWPAIGASLDSVGTTFFLPALVDASGRETQRVASWWLRLHLAQHRFAWAADVQSGISVGRTERSGYLDEAHATFVPLAALATGLRGMNAYMAVERDDWVYSPINPVGKIRPARYEALRAVVRAYRAVPAGDEQQADVGLVWTHRDHVATHIAQNDDWTGLWETETAPVVAPEAPAWWETFSMLLDRDVDFRLWVPGVSPGGPPRLLVYAGSGGMDAASLASLASAVRNRTEALVVTTSLPGSADEGRALEPGLPLDHKLLAGSVPSAIDRLADTLEQLGARAYARSGVTGVWTTVFRALDGSITLGLWNTTAEPYDGPVVLDRALFAGAGASWRVEHVVDGSVRVRDGDALRSLPISVPPAAATVVRFRRSPPG